MSAPNTTRWIGIGLLCLPIYGALTFFSALNPQPDPNTHYDAWARFVTTDSYLLKHLFLSVFGTILSIFGTIALGAYLTRSRAGRLGLVAMVITVLGSALFLTIGGVSTFSAPEQGQMHLEGIEGYREMSPILATYAQLATLGLGTLILLVGNVLLGLAVWRSGILPKWAGALWAAAAVTMLLLGMVYMMTIGAASTPPTVPVGAVLLVISGAWMAFNVLRRPSAQAVTAQAQPSMQ